MHSLFQCEKLSLAVSLTTGLFLLGTFLPSANASSLENAIELQKSINKESAASQVRIDKLADETKDLKYKYRETLLKIESTRSYNKYLQKLLDAHNEKKQTLNAQLSQVDDTNRSLLPLMIRMIDTLERFINLDIPFLLNERLMRVENLKQMISDTDISVAEKYRRITNAYQLELGYGNTIAAYKGELTGSSEKTVEFLRIGRIALFYTSLDGSEKKFWNSTNRSWQELPSEYENSIHKAIRIASKQQAPDLISLPFPPASMTQ